MSKNIDENSKVDNEKESDSNSKLFNELLSHKDDIIVNIKKYFKETSAKQILKNIYNSPDFKNWVMIVILLIYVLSFTSINGFLYDNLSIGAFDWGAERFGYATAGFLDLVLMAFIVFPIIMIGVLTKNSFQNLSPEAWSATTNRHANQASRDDANWDKTWFIGKFFILIRRVMRFFSIIIMIVFSKMATFAIIWTVIATGLVIYFDFFTWWRILLLTMLAIVVADRIWVDVTRWATKRYASNVSQDGGGDITTDNGNDTIEE